jgi:hypothetical protein
MHIIFTRIRALLARLFDEACPSDPVSRMSSRELADLPVHHPKC